MYTTFEGLDPNIPIIVKNQAATFWEVMDGYSHSLGGVEIFLELLCREDVSTRWNLWSRSLSTLYNGYNALSRDFKSFL